MTINFSINDTILVSRSYLGISLNNSSNAVTKNAGRALGPLGTALLTVADTGSINGQSYIRVVPPVGHSKYKLGNGIIIYFNNDTQLNDSFEVASTFFCDYLAKKILNSSGVALTKGSLVYQTGFDTSANLPTMELSSAASAATAFIFGVLEEDIANGGSGSCLIGGAFTADTSAMILNDSVYLSDTPGAFNPTSVAGTIPIVVGQVINVGTEGAYKLNVSSISSGGGGGSQGSTGLGGNTGVQGDTGIQGGTGIQGQTGVQGSTGLEGNAGASGTPGSQGVTGLLGASGATGVAIEGGTGIQGNTGFGVSGNTGLGIQGNTGIQGPGGLVGATGVQGITGFVGITGLSGDTGVLGQTGIQGITGLLGPAAQIGATGVQGIQGTQGDTGIQGTQGDQGNTGLGVQGATGIGAGAGGDGISVLSTLTNLNFDAGATTINAHFVAGDTSTVITSLVIRLLDAADITAVATVSAGWSPSTTDVFTPSELTSVDTTGDMWTFASSSKATIGGLGGAGGSTGLLLVGVTGLVGSTGIFAIDVLGYEF